MPDRPDRYTGEGRASLAVGASSPFVRQSLRYLLLASAFTLVKQPSRLALEA